MNWLKRNYWLIIVLGVIVLALLHPVILSAFTSNGKALTVSELVGQGSSSTQTTIVSGTVKAGSIDWDESSGVLRFSLTDGFRDVNVYYTGPAPANFRPGNELSIDGTYGRDGLFRARSLNSSRPICMACHGD